MSCLLGGRPWIRRSTYWQDGLFCASERLDQYAAKLLDRIPLYSLRLPAAVFAEKSEDVEI